MPIHIKDKTESFKLPGIPDVPNVFFRDLLGTQDPNLQNPIVGALFRMERGPESTPPTYQYDEFGVVIEG
ncbi:hypothetical protein BDW69DRAFT_183817 [Aspergillus filifer]